MSHLAKKELKTFFASCPTGLEGLLDKEAESLGINNKNIKKGGLEFEAFHLAGLKFLVQTTISSRVYIKITAFEFNSNEEFYENVKSQWWHLLMSTRATFKVSTLFDKESKIVLQNSLFYSLKAKDAIVDQIREKKGERPYVDKENPDYSFLIRIEEKANKKSSHPSFFAIIYLDLTYRPLSDRGLRRPVSPDGFNDDFTHEAPMRENLAQGIVRLTEWSPQTEMFADMTCGSGTVILEAIYYAAHLPGSFLSLKKYLEGRLLPWTFLEHNWWKELKAEKEFKKWCQELLETSEKNIHSLPPNHLLANDYDPRCVELTKKSLKALGASNVVSFLNEDIKTATIPDSLKGVVFFNPPYGKRLNNEDDLEELYYQIGENLKNNYKGHRAYILTSESNLRKKISLRTSQRIELKNGNLDCRLICYKMY